MYKSVSTDTTKPGLLVIRDEPGPTTAVTSHEPASGTLKTFKGFTGGKFPKGAFPPPLNPVTIAETQFSSDPVALSLTGVPKWGSRYVSGALGPVVAGQLGLRDDLPGHHVIDANGRDFSLQKAYANVESGDFNSQLFLAELGETVSMLVNPLSGLYKIHAKYRKSRKKIHNLLSSVTKANADVYLQYMFGVSPLINDVQTIYQLVMDKATAKNQLYGKGRVVKKTKFERHSVLQSVYGAQKIDVWSTAETETKLSSKVYYAMQFQNSLYDLIKKWGLNPITLPVTLWEKQPLSFVVDWFFGVKTWLQAMAPKPGVSFLGNYASEKLVEEVRIDRLRYFLQPSQSSKALDQVLGNLWTMHNERLIREVNLPIPSAIYRGAGLDQLGKSVSSVALLIQKIKF